jgi:hypothetical protein
MYDKLLPVESLDLRPSNHYILVRVVSALQTCVCAR